MKNRRQGAYVAALSPALWLLVACLVVLVGPDVWAQGAQAAAAAETDLTRYAFPYLGPDLTGQDLIRGSLVAQANLLGAFNNSSFTALQTLGTLAALVGGIFLAFNRKLWSPLTLAAWLTAVIVIIFVPISARLLFYPIQLTPRAMAGFNISEAARPIQATGYFAFTPQVVAIDLASRAQLIVSDMFRSTGWRDLIGQSLAQNRLRANQVLNAGDTWLQSVKTHTEVYGCSANLADIFNSTQPNQQDNASAAIQTAPVVPTVSFKQRWDQILTHYLSRSYYESMPPAIVLYDDRDIPTNYNKETYALGIQRLYREITLKNDSVAVENTSSAGNSLPAGAISIAAALDAIEAQFRSGFFKPDSLSTANASVNPGFFIIRNKDYSSNQNGPAAQLRQCYYRTPEERNNNLINSNCAGERQSSQVNLTLGSMQPRTPRGHASTFLRASNQIEPLNQQKIAQEFNIRNIETLTAIPMNQTWDRFLVALKTPEVQNMPVGMRDFEGKVVAGSNGAVQSVTTSANTDSGYACIPQAEKLVKTALNNTLHNGTNGALAPLITTLLTPGQFPATGYLSISSIRTPAKINSNLSSTAVNLLNVINGKLRDIDIEASRQNPPRTLTSQERQLVALSSVMELIQINTNKLAQSQTTAERAALADGQSVSVVGWSGLTSVGGGLGQFMGEVLLTVGAFFTGPIAQAFVGFITILVQLSLLALIVITPFLLLAGVLMPGAAAGIFMITVMAAFILQFVPVTLIILNYLGGFIYDIIGATAGPRAWTMQNMLIIGMAGLYTSIVGLTLYLMFKLGDPAAMLGRLSALDGAAKQAADAGFKAVAAMALAPIGAGVLGGIFAAAGGYKNFFKKAAKAAGLDGKGPDGAASGGTATDPKNQPGGPGNALADGAKGMREETTKDGILNPALNNGDVAGMLEGAGFDSAEIGSGIIAGANQSKFSKPDENGLRTGQFQLSRDGQMFNATGKFDSNGGLVSAVIRDQQGNEVERFPAAASVSASDRPEGNVVQDADKVEAENVEVLNNPELEKTLKQNEGGTNTTAAATPSAGLSGATAAQQPAQAAAATSSQAPASKAPEAKKATTDTLPLTPEEQLAYNQIRTAAQAEEFIQKRLERIEGPNSHVQNHNRRVAAEQDAIIAARKKWLGDRNEASLSEAEKKQLKEEFDDPLSLLEQIDTTALRKGDKMMAYKALSDNLKLDMARGGADLPPGFWKTVGSGFLGGFKAVGGGAGSIPVIGGILKGAFNEYYEGAERAKAWQAAGGFWNHFKAGGDAQRMKYYQQEIAPLAAGYQYQQLSDVGAFQQMATSAQFQVAQSVAKMRADLEANIADKLGRTGLKLTDMTVDGKFSHVGFNVQDLNVSAADLTGLGRMSAVQNIGSVYSEVAQQSGESWRIKVLSANGKETKEVDIKPTVMAMSMLYGELAIKQSAKQFDAAMTDWYGISEKIYERDKSAWRQTQGMAYDKKAAAKFMLEDISTDYLAGGHLKMVQGKQTYAGYTGQYQAYLKLRNQENAEIFGFWREPANIAKAQAEITKGLEKGLYKGLTLDTIPKVGFSENALKSMGHDAYANLTKVASAVIGKQRLPLAGLFEEATASGYYSVLEKSAVAPYRVAALQESIAGAVLKAQTSLIESTGISKSVQRQVSFEVDNVRYGLDKMTSRTAERAYSKYGEKVGGLFVETFTEILNKKGAAYAEKALTSISKNIYATDTSGNIIKDKKGKAIKIGKEAYHEISEQFEKDLQEELKNKGLEIDVSKLYVADGRKVGLIEAYYEEALTKLGIIGKQNREL
jgi:hypothetical protein